MGGGGVGGYAYLWQIRANEVFHKYFIIFAYVPFNIELILWRIFELHLWQDVELLVYIRTTFLLHLMGIAVFSTIRGVFKPPALSQCWNSVGGVDPKLPTTTLIYFYIIQEAKGGFFSIWNLSASFECLARDVDPMLI